jgi:hypothetical protein
VSIDTLGCTGRLSQSVGTVTGLGDGAKWRFALSLTIATTSSNVLIEPRRCWGIMVGEAQLRNRIVDSTTQVQHSYFMIKSYPRSYNPVFVVPSHNMVHKGLQVEPLVYQNLVVKTSPLFRKNNFTSLSGLQNTRLSVVRTRGLVHPLLCKKVKNVYAVIVGVTFFTTQSSPINKSTYKSSGNKRFLKAGLLSSGEVFLIG